MKITDVKDTTVKIPLEKVFSGSVYDVGFRCTIITSIETDEGVNSQSYSGDDRSTFEFQHELVTGPLRDAVLGEDPMRVEYLWEKMFSLAPNYTHDFGPRPVMRAIGAIDVSLWDLKGRILNTSVNKMLGGYSNSSPVVRFRYYEQGADEEEIAQLLESKAQGFGGVKLKVGRASLSEDIGRVRRIREALGEDFHMICDANEGWTLEQAIRFAKETEQYNLDWLEEPVQWHSAMENMRKVREATSTKVAAGQGESNKFGCWRLIENESVDVINVDASIAGGITEWQKIRSAAEIKGIKMGHHEEPHISLHLMSAIPNGTFVEVFEEHRDPAYYEMNKTFPVMNSGYVTVPDAPGLGLEFDQDFISKYKIL